MSSYRDLKPRRLKSWLDHDPGSVFLLDVRQPFEFDIASVSGSSLIPLGELEDRIKAVPTDVRIVCICHHGMRSAHACRILAAHGHTHLYNLTGGIERWSTEVDPEVPRY